MSNEVTIVSDAESIVLPADMILREVQRLVEVGTTLEEQQALLDQVMEGHKAQAELAVLAVVRERINRTLEMLKIMDKIKKKIFDDSRLEDLTTDDGLKMLKQLTSEISQNLEFVTKYVDLSSFEDGGKIPEQGDLHLHLHDTKLESREKVRAFVEAFMASAIEPTTVEVGESESDLSSS